MTPTEKACIAALAHLVMAIATQVGIRGEFGALTYAVNKMQTETDTKEPRS
jgi:hypothetical protein